MGRFLFFPLKFSRKTEVRDVLLLLFDEADSDLKGCSEISEYHLVFQNFSIAFRKFLNLIDSSVNLCL